RDVFHVRRPKNYPSLPLFLSLVDNAISRGDQFHPNWPPAQMRQVREAAEYAIFSVLDRSLRDLPPGEPHGALMAALKRRCDTVTVISLNYDLIADNVLIEHATKGGSYPDYGVDIATSLYTDAAKTWSLYKLHGSLGWFYCPRCHRLDVRLSRSGVRMLKAGR